MNDIFGYMFTAHKLLDSPLVLNWIDSFINFKSQNNTSGSDL